MKKLIIWRNNTACTENHIIKAGKTQEIKFVRISVSNMSKQKKNLFPVKEFSPSSDNNISSSQKPKLLQRDQTQNIITTFLWIPKSIHNRLWGKFTWVLRFIVRLGRHGQPTWVDSSNRTRKKQKLRKKSGLPIKRR